MKAVRWHLAFSLVVFLAALWYALPNLPQVGQGPLARFFPQARINLGLDLKGGMNLTLGVDVEKAIQNTLASSGQDMRERALEDKISLIKPRLNAEGLLEVVLPREDQASSFEDMLRKYYPDLAVQSSSSGNLGRTYVIGLSAAARKQAAQ